MSLARLQAVITLSWLGVLLAWVLSHRDRPGVALAGGLAVASAHAWVLGLEFLVQRWMSRQDSVFRATPGQLWRAWLAELRLAPALFCWHQPFRSRRFPDLPVPRQPGERGVVLVHGYLCNRGFWNAWMAVLERQGVPFMAVNLEPVFGSIDDGVPQIEEAVARLTQSTGLAPLLVGHSMGGLAIRAWLRQTRLPRRVHRIATLGSPHAGTWTAHFGHSFNARQLRPASAWLQALERDSPRAWARCFVCFHSNADNMVIPPSAALLEGADQRLLPGLAHVQMAWRPEVIAEVLALRDAPPWETAG